MKNNFIIEAAELCELILNNTPPDKEWGIINLVKSNREDKGTFFSSNSHQQIPKGFYYFYDELPTFLKRKGIFCEIESNGSWFVRIEKRKAILIISKKDEEKKDILMNLTALANEKGWLNIDSFKKAGLVNDANELMKNDLYEIGQVDVDYFINTWEQRKIDDFDNQVYVWYNNAPPRFVTVALFDRKKMQNFITENKGDKPVYDEDLEKLLFRGKSMDFSGQQASLIKILVENINSIVTYEKIIEQIKIDRKQIDDTYKNIKRKIYKKNSIFINDLVLAEHDGLGMFINDIQP